MFRQNEFNKVIHGISLPLSAGPEQACAQALKKAGLPQDTPCAVYRRSIDARRRGNIRRVYSVAVRTDRQGELLKPLVFYRFEPLRINRSARPVVVGSGPAGLFCAYTLAEYGLGPIVVERGRDVDSRAADVEAFRHGGALDPDSNVQFGEGGAGTFSDGKLMTRINDPRCGRVLQIFNQCGAPDDILSDARPHIGTDVLRSVIKELRRKIICMGGVFRYNAKLTDIEAQGGRLRAIYLNGDRYDCALAVIAVGNSARDTFRMLAARGAPVQAKPFSVGFRMEYLQRDVDEAMYGADSGQLPAAEYNFSKVFAQGQCVYSFCMCPGGSVINAASEPFSVVTNGMSLHARDGVNANSALLASVSFDTPEQGMQFQEHLERAAYKLGGGNAPCTLKKNFLDGTVPTSFGRVKPTILPGAAFCDLESLYPPQTAALLRRGLHEFGKAVIDRPDAVLTGPETRTSSPLRILRNRDSFESIGISGLYPCGEGAGYAGGIMSSAVDGIKTAEAVIQRI